ncbi:cobyric acid synthase [Hydrogenovibrio sp. JE_KL2]|uniref:cobyric acid synthase n=1 Tax=Hydrogenovibrio sp. JE_KL2 TaxID=2651188 RepID=UPI00128B47C4|nr:cobyric acid synthase [Hydrogenovibrio sp. JE_KL2]MPQ75810.1 cobyric acid synthase [Hydrogenovibrio sp. JE_KL2]
MIATNTSSKSHNPSHCLMVQGCTSDAGKSTLVAGLCRVLARQGLSIAPFKPQNMALNSAVTEDGGEIGRAQALQAFAAGVPTSVHMNPVLLKPNSDVGAQVIIQGKSIGNYNALNYHEYKPTAANAVLDSFVTLRHRFNYIITEGAGSPAEVNLREGDIANMGFAESVDCPVILVADIDKGGVFAHIVGTLACLSDSEQNRIKGFVINKFRGDLALLKDGLDWLEAKTGKPVLGVVPYLHGLFLDAEDAVDFQQTEKSDTSLKVIAPLFPHISNHTDFAPLQQHPDIEFQWVKHNEAIPPADLIILPGSKNVAFDLQWLKTQGWETHLNHHLRYGGKLIGICGGLQMLGQAIHDPHGMESESGDSQHGLGLLNYETTLMPEKALQNRTGRFISDETTNVVGYEIHCGQTNLSDLTPAIILEDGSVEGGFSEDNQIFVTYLHGVFDQPSAIQYLMNWTLGKDNNPMATQPELDADQQRHAQLDLLANTLESCLDMDKLLNLLGAQND